MNINSENHREDVLSNHFDFVEKQEPKASKFNNKYI
jgi:hypothetical protein